MLYSKCSVALFASAAAMIAYPNTVTAQTLEIAPVTIDLSPGQRTGIIRVTNRGDQSTTIQTRPFVWSQKGGEDDLGPTADLVLSPPFSTLAPGDTQTIRIVLRKPATIRESTYRLLIDQLPAAADPGSVHVALRVSLPVFAAPSEPVHGALTWKLAGSDPVKRLLLVRNSGTRRVKVTSLAVGGSSTVPGFTFRYILAGSEAAIPVTAGASGWPAQQRTVHISGSTDQGRVEADAPVVPAS